MKVIKFFRMLRDLPDQFNMYDLEIVSHDDGRKFKIREDVSQFNIRGNKIQLAVTEIKPED